MVNFLPSKKTAQDFNNGVEYIDGQGNETGDAVQAETINNLVESVLYTQEQAEGAASTANGAVDTANNALTVANGLDGQIKTANATANSANTTSQEAKNIAEEAKGIAEDAQKGVGTKVSVSGEVVATFDADTKVNKSGDIINGNLTVNGGLSYYNGNNNTSFELGKYGKSGIEFHSQNEQSGVFLDYDAFIQASSPDSTTSAGTAQLVYSARQHVFDGPIVANSDNNFLAHGNEFTFVGEDCNNTLVWFNYRGGNIGSYHFGSGRADGSVADIYAGSIFDHSERVYSPNNLQPIIDAYKVGFAGEQNNSYGYVVINDGYNGDKIAIQFGMFTNAGTITFAKPFIMTPFVLTSPNGSSDMQTQRVAVKQVTTTYFTTYSTGSYAGRYIAIGQI